MGPGLGVSPSLWVQGLPPGPCYRHVTPRLPLNRSLGVSSSQPHQSTHSKIKRIPTYLVPHLLVSLLLKAKTHHEPRAEACPTTSGARFIHHGAFGTRQPTQCSGPLLPRRGVQGERGEGSGEGRVSQSLTSRSRICKEGQGLRRAHAGTRGQGHGLACRALAPEQSLEGSQGWG